MQKKLLAQKYRTVAELENAYLALQAAFTKKCQQLRQAQQQAAAIPADALPAGPEQPDAPIERPTPADDPADDPAASAAPAAQPTPLQPALSAAATACQPDAEQPRQAAQQALSPEALQALRVLAVQEYLQAVLHGQPPAVVRTEGSPVSPPTRPASFEEAGKIACRLFG